MVITERIVLEIGLKDGWTPLGSVGPAEQPGSISTLIDGVRRVLIFGWEDGRPRVSRSKGGIDIEAGCDRVLVAPVGLELLSDLTEPYETEQVTPAYSVPIRFRVTWIEAAEDAPEWRERAACRGADTDLFFPASGEDPHSALALCAGCPVRRDCGEYAIERPSLKGIWGGLSDKERGRVRRRRARDRAGLAPVPAPVSSIEPRTTRRQRTPDRFVDEIAEGALRVAAGKWFRVAQFHGDASVRYAANLRAGRLPAPPGRWDFEARRGVLYARLIEAAPQEAADGA